MKNKKQCHYCGNVKAEFYHVDCAQQMSSIRIKEYSRIILNYEKEIKYLFNEIKKQLIDCPFCNEMGFDLMGLKCHLTGEGLLIGSCKKFINLQWSDMDTHNDN